MGRQDSRVVVTLNFWTLVHYALGHEVYPWWQLFFSAHREDRVKEAEKQLIILLFVKKLLKFVLFMKVYWKSRKWSIKLFLKSSVPWYSRRCHRRYPSFNPQQRIFLPLNWYNKGIKESKKKSTKKEKFKIKFAAQKFYDFFFSSEGFEPLITIWTHQQRLLQLVPLIGKSTTPHLCFFCIKLISCCFKFYSFSSNLRLPTNWRKELLVCVAS